MRTREIYRTLTIMVGAVLGLWLASGAFGAVEFEVGTLNLPGTGDNQTTFTPVTFDAPFATPPVVVSLATNDGGDPCALRIRNVTTTGFEIAQVEPPNKDGQHAAFSNVAWAAMEPGRITNNGFTFEAGFHSTATTIRSTNAFPSAGGHDTVNFAAPFGSAPIVLSDIQTMNNESTTDPPPGGPSTPWLQTSVRSGSITATGFDVALERAEVNDGSTVSANEDIGYIAITRGSGSMSPLAGGDPAVADVLFDFLLSPDSIDGWQNTNPDGVGRTINFNQGSFTAAPLVVASMARRDGGDGGWLRRGAITATGVNLTVDEDQFNDSERNHTAEAASIAAFGPGPGFAGQFDGFRVSLVPEPGTLAVWSILAGLGIGLGLVRRRRNG